MCSFYIQILNVGISGKRSYFYTINAHDSLYNFPQPWRTHFSKDRK